MWSALELREVRVFLVVAEELHFTRAAERLLLTPSRVSQTIRALENRLGGPLFERTSRRVALTTLGEQFQAGMAPLYEQMRAVYTAAAESTTEVSGVLRVGMYSPVSAGPRFADLVLAFEDRHPRCRVEVHSTATVDPLTLLRRGELDLAATRLPVTDPDFVVGPQLTEDARAVVVSRRHPLALQESISYEDLTPYTVSDVTWASREMMDDFVPPRTPAGVLLRRRSNRTVDEALFAVAAGHLVHPTVASFLDYHAYPELVTIPIRDLPPSRTALVALAGHSSTAIDAFFRVVDTVLATTTGQQSITPRGSR